MSMSNIRPDGSPQPEAGPSRPSSSYKTNPQLTDEPWFAYPTPPAEVIDQELPPYLESENVPMGPLLDRLARRGHVGLRQLVEQTLPRLEPRQKPREVISYARNTRQAILKYLAVLRWKTAVDVPLSEASTTTLPNGQHGSQQPSFPTPHSNGDSFSPGIASVKGKGRMTGLEEDVKPAIRGKVTDAKRITEYLLYQNSQHDMAIQHVQHSAKMIESLRIRNPDLLTALSLLTRGTYTRLPTAITEAFVPRAPLANADILDTLRRLDAHILYRLKCVDYVPPDLRIDRIKDGRAYIVGGKGEWRAEVSLTGFGTGDQSRWWLTGLEWDWRSRLKGADDTARGGKRFKGNERQQILDTINREVLPAADPNQSSDPSGKVADIDVKDGETSQTKADAPLVRLANFIQHLSLSYQLEMLFTQAMTLSRQKWRNQLAVEIDRAKKALTLKYWIRPRSAQPVAQTGQNRRPGQPQAALGAPRSPAFGATLTVSLAESTDAEDAADALQRELAACEESTSERVLRLGLAVRWEIGEGGVGGGWKAGEIMDTSSLSLDSQSLDIEDILLPATRAHAAHLTRHHAIPLMSSLATPLILPTLQESESRPLALYVSIPSSQRRTDLIVWVSSHTGLVEIEDDGARLSVGAGGEERANRTRLATNGLNTGVAKLGDALKRLIIAIFTDNLENQTRQLGWSPARKLPIKLNELAKNDLPPASTIFVPLPTSKLHYLVVKVSPSSIDFELLRLAREPAASGVGMKLAIRDRSPLDLQRLRQRSREANPKRKREEGGVPLVGIAEESSIDVSNRDLRDLFVFSNALVARTLVEQQLKDRAIPYAEQYPRATDTETTCASSAIAGLIPNIVVNAKDLLNDGRAADVAMPKVFLQIKDWWKGDKCQVVTVVQLRHRASSPTNGASPGFNNASTSSAARAEGISFDQNSSIVRFTAKDISRCVPAFLEQWERLSKVIMVAGDVNRLNKLAVFKDLRMLAFDLRTATFSYSPGFNASITYSPTSDSYECSFSRSSAPNTPATPPAVVGGETSPHELLAPLLSHRLNELTRRSDVKKGTVGREFIALLRNTLPILLEIDAIRASSSTDYPRLVVVGVDDFRLVWDAEGTKRYAVDLSLSRDDRYLITDAAAPSPDGLVDLSCGPLTPLPSFSLNIDKIYSTLRTSYSGEKAQGVLAIKLDKGASLAVSVGVVGEVVRGLCAEIETSIAGGGMGKGKGA